MLRQDTLSHIDQVIKSKLWKNAQFAIQTTKNKSTIATTENQKGLLQ